MATDARDDFDHNATRRSTAPRPITSQGDGGGFSTATGGGTSMGTSPVTPPAAGGDAGIDPDGGDRDTPGGTAGDGVAHEGDGGGVDQPGDGGGADLPGDDERTGPPRGTDKLPLGESDIEDRLRAAQRAQHHDAGEPDAAFG